MTIVCFRDGVLAADRLVISNYGGRVGHRSKIFQGVDSYWYGFAGGSSDSGLFQRWVNAGAHLKDIPEFEGHQAIQIRLNKVGLSTGKKPVFVDVDAPFYAIGSGWQLALGAMEMGATAEQAVEVAIRHDEGCGGQIDVMRIHETQSGQYAASPVNFPDRIEPLHLGGPR